jgi:sugar phosphate isomerase/epimerase
MKIGVSTLAMYPKDLYLILECLEEYKVGVCEIINEFPYHNVGPEDLESFQINTTIHAPLSDINLASHNRTIRKASIEQVKKSMDLSVELNSEIVVVHPGQMPILKRNLEEKIFKYNLESLKECSRFAQDLGISMCVENMPDIEGLLFQDLEELYVLVNEIDADITLDVGHAHNNRFAAEEMIKFDRIKHVHLSDNDGSFDDHKALGTGDIDFKSVIAGLKRVNYDEMLIIEVKSFQEVEPSLNYLRDLI